MSLLVSLEMQVAEGRNLIDMYRHHSTSHIWNKISLKVNMWLYFSLYCVRTFRSIVQLDFVRKMIPTFLKVNLRSVILRGRSIWTKVQGQPLCRVMVRGKVT